MTKPVYKIETWTGAVKDYTITDEAIGIYTKEVLTDGVGHFKFSVPTVKGVANPYYYGNIALNDTVKIWFGYGAVSGDPDFVGKVERISAPLSTQSGWIREISGYSQGGVSQRRFKKDKFYDAVGFSTIVTEWATDLGLGTGDIATDATAVTLEVRTKSYFDLLREICDYWVNAGTQLKKDFYIDVDNDLVCKDRPFRTTGIETLTVGENIERYHVLRNASFVKNDITVYGAAEKKLPDDESWTEVLDNWTADDGTVDRYDVGQQVGTWYIRGHTGATSSSYAFKRDIPRVTIRDISQVCFWRYNATNCSTSYCRLRAPDASNYFQADLGNASADWSFKQLSMGPNHIYDAAENPNGIWTETGSPNWWNIKYIEFKGTYSINDRYPGVDGLYFYPVRPSHTSSDATSKTSYGQRDMEVTDDKLHSDSECQKRAETLLYQRKDAPIQISIRTLGNTNVLVGDRLPITIPAEGITAQNYDVISVEQTFAKGVDQPWLTTATMVNSADVREPMPITGQQNIIKMRRRIRGLSVNEQAVM